jgi:peptidoglycan/LPS O-acetylase OafA/YrhL
MVLSLAYKAWVISTVSEWEYEPWLLIPPATIDTFMVGMALACLSVRASRQGWPALLAAAGRRVGVCWLLAVGTYAALCMFEAQWEWRVDRFETVAGLQAKDFFATLTFAWSEAHVLIVALLLVPAVVGAVNVKGIASVLTSKVVVWIGLVSYGLYLWHMFVLHQVADQFGWSGVQIVAVPFVAMGCYQMTLGVAAISWYGVERRVLSLAHRVPLARTLSGNVNEGVVK